MVRPGIPPEIEIAVERWSDSPKGGGSASAEESTASAAEGVMRTLEVPGPSGVGLRLVRVWMPAQPEPGARWPVLYLLDGQNVFGDGAGSPRGWRTQTTAAALVRQGAVRPFVIVAVPHGGETRVSEYLPAAALGDVTPGASETVRWVTQVVAPAVEALGVTETGPATIGGASLGALAALEIAARAPERFNRVLMESPSLTTGDRLAWRRWMEGLPTWPAQVWLGVGGSELPDPDRSAELVATVQALEQRLVSRGVARGNVRLRVDADAAHDEAAWGARFGEAARFLFPPR
jgi:predicted alpha/beta superfamily hydrolase